MNLNNDETLENESGFKSEEDNKAIYPDATIQISRDQYSIKDLCDMIESGDFQIDPDFQRNEIWNHQQKSELVESVLMGVPLPTMYVFEQKNGKKQVIDGRQRLTALRQFLNNVFSLNKLKVLPNFNGLKFKDLEGRYQSKYRRFQLMVIVIEPPTPERIKFDIFSRVNRGGTPLSNQEMRNAMFYGNSTRFLAELAAENIFKEATGNGISEKRMKDRYVILRFIAFYMLYNNKISYTYRGDLDDFLAFTMNFLNQTTNDELQNLKKIFTECMTKFYSVMGKDGFRFKSSENQPKRPINMLLFETLSYIFSMLPQIINKESVKHKTDILKEILDKEYEFKSSTDSKPGADYRFITIPEKWRQL